MDLKGGLGYLNMRGYSIGANIDPSSSVFVDGLYDEALKIVNSKKICVLYNAAPPLSDNPLVVLGYILSDGIIAMRYFAIANDGSASNVGKRIFIKPDSSYYITN